MKINVDSGLCFSFKFWQSIEKKGNPLYEKSLKVQFEIWKVPSTLPAQLLICPQPCLPAQSLDWMDVCVFARVYGWAHVSGGVLTIAFLCSHFALWLLRFGILWRLPGRRTARGRCLGWPLPLCRLQHGFAGYRGSSKWLVLFRSRNTKFFRSNNLSTLRFLHPPAVLRIRRLLACSSARCASSVLRPKWIANSSRFTSTTPGRQGGHANCSITKQCCQLGHFPTTFSFLMAEYWKL